MKMKLENILALNHILKRIIDNEDLKIDALFKFRLLGIMKSLEVHVMNFETVRNEKIREYGTENEDGNIEISKDDAESLNHFSNALKDVIASDVDVDIRKLKAEDVFNKGLPAEYILGLYSVIETPI